MSFMPPVRATTLPPEVWGVRIEEQRETWDRYVLGKELAAGGMGAVHEIYPAYRPTLVAKIFNDAMKTRIKGDPRPK